MSNFSRDTFNKLKHYVGVRLQQGVPLVDADWNELEDIRKEEIEAYLKWFVDNGVPRGNEGFKITAIGAGAENDFLIKGGDETQEVAGCCLVDGLLATIEKDMNYTQQELYATPELAPQWGVDTLEDLTTPAANPRVDMVYLDIWEREVDAQEDEELVNPKIGVETCVRRKREWVIRVAEGQEDLPDPGDGHVFYAVAKISREVGVSIIDESSITDLRQPISTLMDHDHTIGKQVVTGGIADRAVTLSKMRFEVLAEGTYNGQKEESRIFKAGAVWIKDGFSGPIYLPSWTSKTRNGGAFGHPDTSVRLSVYTSDIGLTPDEEGFFKHNVFISVDYYQDDYSGGIVKWQLRVLIDEALHRLEDGNLAM